MMLKIKIWCMGTWVKPFSWFKQLLTCFKQKFIWKNLFHCQQHIFLQKFLVDNLKFYRLPFVRINSSKYVFVIAKMPYSVCTWLDIITYVPNNFYFTGSFNCICSPPYKPGKIFESFQYDRNVSQKVSIIANRWRLIKFQCHQMETNYWSLIRLYQDTVST